MEMKYLVITSTEPGCSGEYWRRQYYILDDSQGNFLEQFLEHLLLHFLAHLRMSWVLECL